MVAMCSNFVKSLQFCQRVIVKLSHVEYRWPLSGKVRLCTCICVYYKFNTACYRFSREIQGPQSAYKTTFWSAQDFSSCTVFTGTKWAFHFVNC